MRVGRGIGVKSSVSVGATSGAKLTAAVVGVGGAGAIGATEAMVPITGNASTAPAIAKKSADTQPRLSDAGIWV